jgi:HK97 family phage major capsid protein
MFVEKTADELASMDAKNLQEYYVAKLKNENTLLEERLVKLEGETNDVAIKSLTTEVEELKAHKVKSLESALETQGIILKKLQDGSLSGSSVRMAENSVRKALADNREDFIKAKDGRHSFRFELKAAGDMTIAGNVSGGNVPQAQRLEGINDIAEREAKSYALFPKLRTASNTIEWVYETGQDGTIDGTAEGAAKDQIDNDFVVTSVALVKRAAYFKVSTEMLDDVSFMEGWLRNKLIVRLFLDVDNQVLNGNGAAPNLKGVIDYATAFAAGTFAGTVDSANNADSLVVAANQIRLANHNGALTIMMHPSDVAALKLVKLSASDKRYVERLMMVGSQMSLDGIPIIENTNIAVGDFLIGDFSKGTIVEKSGIEVEIGLIEIGLDGNDFTKNMRTILAEWRGQLFVQNNDTTAFVKGTFSITNDALETP